MKRRRLTEEHRTTIRIALYTRFEQAITYLDFHDTDAFWLRQAGESWDAYKAVAGYPIHGPVS